MRRAGPAAAVLALACAGPAEKPSGGGAPGADTGDPGAAPLVADAGPDRAVEIGVPLTFSAPAAPGVTHLWDLGDGRQLTGAAVEATFPSPGTRVVVLQVTHEDGRRQTDSARVVVHLPLLSPAPVASTTLALSADGATLAAALPDAGVALLDVAPDGQPASPTLWLPCEAPRTVAWAGATLLAACESPPGLAARAADGGTTFVPLPAASRPFGVIVAPGAAHVSLNGAGALATVPLGDDGLPTGEATVETGFPDARGLGLVGGALYVTRWRSPPSGGELRHADGALTTLLPDTRGDSDNTTGGVPNLLEQVVPAPDGAALFVPALHANILRGTFRSGEPLTFETTLRAVLATVPPGAATDALADRKQLDERGESGAVVVSPLGDRLYVLHTGTRSLTVLDRWTGNIAGSILGLGAAPTGLALSADGAHLYVLSWLGRSVAAFDVSDPSRPPVPLGAAVPLLAAEPLPAEVLRGKVLFWDAADPRLTRSGYVSCAHCHPDASHDGQTWDFTDRGEGLRNTPPLLGRAGTGMGPVHWTGNFDEIQDFENDIRLHFGGDGLLSDADFAATADTLGAPKAGLNADLDALAAYVASLDRTPPSPHPPDPAGADAFAAAGCDTCHGGPRSTDSDLLTFLRHDVGTLGPGSGQRLGGPLDGLDTPTLHGTWDTGPWLHDGSAPTVTDAIRAHRSADGLAPATVDAIARHVLSL